MKRLAADEEDNKNHRKSIALKSTNIEDMESEDEECQCEINKFMKLMFQKFKELLRHKKNFKNPEEKRRKDGLGKEKKREENS